MEHKQSPIPENENSSNFIKTSLNFNDLLQSNGHKPQMEEEDILSFVKNWKKVSIDFRHLGLVPS